MSHDPTNDAHDCASCPVASGRREFMRDLFGGAVAALSTLGIARQAFALPMGLISPLARGGETRTYPIPATDCVQIDRDAEVILVRWQNAVYAFSLSCPHQNTALRWIDGAARFQCPKHKSKYQPDGTFIEGRATRAMDRFSVRRDGANVVVDLDALHKQDSDAAGWNAAVVHIA
jgi:nitrite reductase/ring-hydroxylating ferredoxin subunit